MANKEYIYYQPNKKDLKNNYADCVIRALTKVLNRSWLEVFDEITVLSREMQAPFNVKPCYAEFLRQKGFKYVGVSNKKGCKRPTVKEFAQKHKEGTFFLHVSKHCVACVDGKYYDTWDSGRKCLYGYWFQEIANKKENYLYLQETMKDCLKVRGYEVTDEKLTELWRTYEDCQAWSDDNEMISGTTEDEVEDFVKYSPCVEEVFGKQV